MICYNFIDIYKKTSLIKDIICIDDRVSVINFLHLFEEL